MPSIDLAYMGGSSGLGIYIYIPEMSPDYILRVYWKRLKSKDLNPNTQR